MPGVSSGYGKSLEKGVSKKYGTQVVSSTFPERKYGPLGDVLYKVGTNMGERSIKQLPAAKTRKTPLIETRTRTQPVKKKFNTKIGGTSIVQRPKAKRASNSKAAALLNVNKGSTDKLG